MGIAFFVGGTIEISAGSYERAKAQVLGHSRIGGSKTSKRRGGWMSFTNSECFNSHVFKIQNFRRRVGKYQAGGDNLHVRLNTVVPTKRQK
jgi:hypothetical protein